MKCKSVSKKSPRYTNQGLIISANEIFWMSAGIFLVLLGLVWFAKPPFGAGGGGGGAH
ncbi:TPA: hypothetical protein PPH02_002128 [Escherichia coli]|nr:hypothetical protein [Escherichia coli]HDI9778506.1 hypothetical protein [Escherichia coli]